MSSTFDVPKEKIAEQIAKLNADLFRTQLCKFNLSWGAVRPTNADLPTFSVTYTCLNKMSAIGPGRTSRAMSTFASGKPTLQIATLSTALSATFASNVREAGALFLTGLGDML